MSWMDGASEMSYSMWPQANKVWGSLGAGVKGGVYGELDCWENRYRRGLDL